MTDHTLPRIIIACCGTPPPGISADRVEQLAAIPTRKELRFLDEEAAAILPEDPTPSLEEIASMPNVPHLGSPQYAPQQVSRPLRVVVIGSDAALSAVITRLMRADALWVEVAFVPTQRDSHVARLWQLPSDPLSFAISGSVRPKPLMRDDAGVAVAGIATITAWDAGEITGEIIVDDHVLIHHQGKKKAPRRGIFGAQLTSTLDAPGAQGNVIVTPLREPETRGLVAKLRGFTLGLVDEDAWLGRALQGGGIDFRVEVDGVSRKRPVERVTFYRHLRDLQSVRP
ncbi:hypothetical protein CP258_09580 [Corynebacterium pseudotuberculosis 258]|uniref:Uncharacterized protein n=1 Tax=Corynebacterium pseudotuberculosis 258 TaxID=1168865 RepID=A0AAU8PTU4_CORPS|nr:hypothetical protein [Corynebacterium pseudotuberculosis]AEQ07383.1 hypothetical protein CPCIP5297_09580 [Corynebacterium pseudotuberculosis CIP 52.97]AFK17488.2 hypothetical protein CP258_09580 [Corynebacterium pseudotuberculosis 258]